MYACIPEATLQSVDLSSDLEDNVIAITLLLEINLAHAVYLMKFKPSNFSQFVLSILLLNHANALEMALLATDSTAHA